MAAIWSGIGFSPKWTEGTLRSELRGFAQAAKIPVDLLRGRRPQVGNSAQAMATVLLGSLIGTQLLNLLTRGKTTWQNPEEDHHWDAWLPGGPHNQGFFFSPLSIAAEFTHGLHKYMAAGANALDATVHIASNKLSGPARGVKDLVTGEDWRGQPFASLGERLKAAALDALPSPLPLSGTIEKDPKAMLGYKFNHQQGSGEKQLLSMAGLKVDNAQSARSQMFALAQPFRGVRPTASVTPPSQYAALRTALANGDQDTARSEFVRLVKEGHRTIEQVSQHAVGLQAGHVHPESFTNNPEKDRQMFAGFTPEQRQVYRQAFADRVADAKLLAHVFQAMPADQKRALQIASAQNRSKAKPKGPLPPGAP